MTDHRVRPWASTPRVVAMLVAAFVLLGSDTVHADPAGPTDYESEVVAVEPPMSELEATVIGGDSFFELTVENGTEVFVVGYQDEDYLWFRSDGVVFENQTSPSTYLNGDRYGGGDVPASADADADPDWKQVSTGGSWVWHDHRAHWMQESRPVGFAPGDQILDATIPLRVVEGDGTVRDVAIRVTSTWLPAPSLLPALLGLVVGLGVVAGAWWLRRRKIAPVAASVPVAVLALVVGAWQYWSLPAATGPRLVWVVIPAIALMCAVVGVAVGRRSDFAAEAACLVVGVELAVWGIIKRDGLWAAIVPTDAPMWLDRFATSLAVACGAALALSALWWLFVGAGSVAGAAVSDSREPTDSPRPAHP